MPAILKHIEVDNFKSYKGKLIIGPLKPFTAVVGPNGSGRLSVVFHLKYVINSEFLINYVLQFTVFRKVQFYGRY